MHMSQPFSFDFKSNLSTIIFVVVAAVIDILLPKELNHFAAKSGQFKTY
jgi:hypothetical protein